MRTDDLISMLSTGVTPVQRHTAARRFTPALLLGGAGSTMMMALMFHVRPDIGTMVHTPLFWLKLAFPAVLFAAALLLVNRLSRPGVVIGKRWSLPAIPVLVLWVTAAALLSFAAPDTRTALIFGHTWRTCPFNIVLLSIPAFIGVFWAMRGLAPTRLRLAGAMGGMLAGTIATMAYCFHCPEMSPVFWAVWYLLGMVLTSLIGAWLGPRVLRW
jgi:hypothetical protein